MSLLERLDATIPGVVVATAVANSTVVNKRGFTSGSVCLTSGTTATITIYGGHSEATVTRTGRDSDDVALGTLSVASDEFVDLPPAIMSLPYIAFQGDAAGVVSVYLVS